MFANQFVAKAVQRADHCAVQQRKLLRDPWVGSVLVQGSFEAVTDALAHFRRGGFGERHHQNAIQTAVSVQQLLNARFHERPCLARPGACNDQHVALRANSCLLLRSKWPWTIRAHQVSFFSNRLNECTQGSILQMAAFSQYLHAFIFPCLYGSMAIRPSKTSAPNLRSCSSVESRSASNAARSIASLSEVFGSPLCPRLYLNWSRSEAPRLSRTSRALTSKSPRCWKAALWTSFLSASASSRFAALG